MALQSASPPSPSSAQLVGNAFVEQYYHILHKAPQLVYRFYKESSVVSRPDLNGQMTSVTTMKGIKEKILSLDYKDFKAEMKTADAQKSYNDGVMVVVTGCLMGKDYLKRKFVQSFFLAPQVKGYYVLNDVFRYVEDSEPLKTNPTITIKDSPTAPVTPDPETTHIPDPPMPDPVSSLVEENQVALEKVHDLLDNEVQLVVNGKADIVEIQSNTNENDVSTVAESATSSSPEDAPKKSYASIVSSPTYISHSRVSKGNAKQSKVSVPTNTVSEAPVKTEKPSSRSVAPPLVPETPVTSSIILLESSSSPDEVEGHSVYIRNLPSNLSVPELEAVFKKFGPIKQGGIQVRSHKHVGHCFDFVEFQSSSSMDNAIQNEQAIKNLFPSACLKFKAITEELMKNKAKIKDNKAKEEEENVAAASRKIETPKIEDQNKFNQELKTSLEQSNTNPPTAAAAAAEHEESVTGNNHKSNEEEEEECENDKNELLRDEVQKLRGEVSKLRVEIDVLEMEKFENEQEVKKVIDKYEMKVTKVKKARDEERRKWEEEKNELAGKLCAATACSELYKGLLHDLCF